MFATRNLFFAFLIILALGHQACAADRLKLWEIVSKQCVPNVQKNDDTLPCAQVSIDQGLNTGYVIFPDQNGVAQFLLIPTRQISGIESPDILDQQTPNYWAKAWNARIYAFTKLNRLLPWDAMGLAVNSKPSRSQDQFHIHIDCLQPDIREQLQQHNDDIGEKWAKTNFDLKGHRYMAKRVADINATNPFKSLIDELGIKQADMGDQTLVIVGSSFKGHNDYIMLEDHVDASAQDLGHGEDLLDPSCAIAK